MMAVRLPFVSRLMIFEIGVRLERLCAREHYPALVSPESLANLHARTLAEKELRRLQLGWEREKLYAGFSRLR